MQVKYKRFNTVEEAIAFCNTDDKIDRIINIIPSSYVYNANYSIALPSDYILIYEEEC